MLRSVRLSLLVGGLTVGCGDNWSARDGGLAGTTGAGGSLGRQAGGAGTGGGAVVTGTKVFSGNASMLPNGPSCTSEIGATGDRWCAFLARSSNTSSLFVVNVSQVVAGLAVTCGAGADPNCLLLAPSIGSRDPSFHGTLFQGDTLVYYDAALPPHVWRPGMTGGRRLVDVSTTLDAVFGTPARTGTAVACLGLPPTQLDPTLTRADLLAGKADGPSEPLLTVIDNIIVANSADAGGTPRFSATVWALSRTDNFDGYYVRLSDCNKMTIAPGVAVLASIGERVLIFMDQFDPQAATGSMRFLDVAPGNTLQTGAPTPIADHVATYAISGPAPGALLYTVNAGGSTDGVYLRWFGP